MAITGHVNTSDTKDTITVTMDRLSGRFLLRHLRGEVITLNPSPIDEFTNVLEDTLRTDFGKGE